MWQSSSVALWRDDNLPERQPFLQHSTNQVCMVEWPEESHSSVKGTWSLPKVTWRSFRAWEIKSDGTKFQLHGQKSGSAHHLANTISTVKNGGGIIMLWGCFLGAVTGRLVRVEGKMNEWMNEWRWMPRDILDDNLLLSALDFKLEVRHPTSHTAKRVASGPLCEYPCARAQTWGCNCC